MKLDDWLTTEKDAPESTTKHRPGKHGSFQQTMVIKFPENPASDQIDPWSALAGLRLSGDEKVYLHGAMNALQLPRSLEHELLTRYREEWERAANRCTNPNGIDNAGRRAANLWIQQGAPGFIRWIPDG